MAVWQGILISGKGSHLRKPLIHIKVRIPGLILILAVTLSAQESEDSTATTLDQETSDSESANRIKSLEDSLSETQALLKLASDSVATLRVSQENSVAAGAHQTERIEILSDSLTATRKAREQLAERIDSLSTIQASLEEQVKEAADSLSALSARHRTSLASNQQQAAQITQLGDSLAGRIESLRNLAIRRDSLLVLKESTVLKLASANDSLATLGILYKGATSSNRRQIIEISSIRDSLARSIIYGDDMRGQSDSLSTLKDALVHQLGQAVDSIATQVGLMEILQEKIQLKDSLLASVRDSLSAGVGREVSLHARHDSLATVKDSLAASLDQAKMDLAAADSLEKALTAEINVIGLAFQGFESQLASGEADLSDIYDQVKTAAIAAGEESLNAELDAQYLAHLNDLIEYKGRSRRLGRVLARDSEEMHRYKLEEFNQYLSWAKLRGKTPEALNLLAALYYGQKDEVRGALTYLKTVFLYGETPAGEFAIGSLGERIKEGDEIARLLNEVALNPDSMKVVQKSVYRYFHYLNNIRRLQHADARRYFQNEANQFVSFYPDVYNVDLLHAWTAESYHALKEFDTEIMTYLKMRHVYPESAYRAQITFSLAEVTAINLNQHQLGADRYAIFLEEFAEHKLAPRALTLQAKLYESELKQPEKAAELYRSLADTYFDDELAPVALLSYAELLKGKLKVPAEAMAVYQEILAEYGDDPGAGLPALEGLAALSKKSRQYDVAVDFYLEIFTRFPNSAEQVAAGLVEAADIYEVNLKNLDEALQTLRLVINNYPKYKKIKAVQRKVQRLEKKIG